MHKTLTLTVALLFMVMPAYANTLAPPPANLHGLQAVGHGTATYMMLDVYDAALYTPNGQWASDTPLALSLTYRMSLKGAAIADRSTKEIQEQNVVDPARLDDWRKQMIAIFPDVQSGTNLTGIRTMTGETEFFKDGTFIGRIADKDFGKRFFDIWLGQNTNDASLRKQLVSARTDP